LINLDRGVDCRRQADNQASEHRFGKHIAVFRDLCRRCALSFRLARYSGAIRKGWRTFFPCYLGHSALASRPIFREAYVIVIRATRIWRPLLASLLGILVIVSLMTLSGIPSVVRLHVYWLLWSGQYRQAVLSSPLTEHQLLHTEWNGDGWGGIAVGDWTGYVVYDPSVLSDK
jgi:hypothetical protein